MDERAQILLIQREFESQGYTVTTEHPVQVGDQKLRLDIVAQRMGPLSTFPEFVVVELVNPTGRSAQILEERANILSKIFSDQPGYRLEYRFLETTEEEHRRRSIQSDAAEVVRELNRPLLRRSSTDPTRISETAVADWWRWVRAIRTLAQATGYDPTEDIETLSESLMEETVIPRYWKEEMKAEGITYHYLHETMLAALEGQPVPYNVANVLRWYVKAIRKVFNKRFG